MENALYAHQREVEDAADKWAQLVSGSTRANRTRVRVGFKWGSAESSRKVVRLVWLISLIKSSAWVGLGFNSASWLGLSPNHLLSFKTKLLL